MNPSSNYNAGESVKIDWNSMTHTNNGNKDMITLKVKVGEKDYNMTVGYHPSFFADRKMEKVQAEQLILRIIEKVQPQIKTLVDANPQGAIKLKANLSDEEKLKDSSIRLKTLNHKTVKTLDQMPENDTTYIAVNQIVHDFFNLLPKIKPKEDDDSEILEDFYENSDDDISIKFKPTNVPNNDSEILEDFYYESDSESDIETSYGNNNSMLPDDLGNLDTHSD